MSGSMGRMARTIAHPTFARPGVPALSSGRDSSLWRAIAPYCRHLMPFRSKSSIPFSKYEEFWRSATASPISSKCKIISFSQSFSMRMKLST